MNHFLREYFKRLILSYVHFFYKTILKTILQILNLWVCIIEIINTYNPSNNKTNSILTIYEAALIVGKRATQITYGAEPVIEYNETDTPESIAIRELLTKKIP